MENEPQGAVVIDTLMELLASISRLDEQIKIQQKQIDSLRTAAIAQEAILERLAAIVAPQEVA